VTKSILLNKVTVAERVKRSLSVVGPRYSLPCSQQPVIPRIVTQESLVCTLQPCIKIRFNINPPLHAQVFGVVGGFPTKILCAFLISYVQASVSANVFFSFDKYNENILVKSTNYGAFQCATFYTILSLHPC
jgi:hypothetical protein